MSNNLHAAVSSSLKTILPALAIFTGFAMVQAAKPVNAPIWAETGVVEIPQPKVAPKVAPKVETIDVGDTVIVASAPRGRSKPRHTCGAVARPLVQGSGTVAFTGDWGCP